MAWTHIVSGSAGLDAGSGSRAVNAGTATHRIMVVAIVTETGNGTPNSVTFNGQALTLRRTYVGSDFQVNVYSRSTGDSGGLAAGSNTLAESFASGTPDYGVMWQVWSSDVGTPTFDKTADVADDSSPVSGSIVTANADELIMGFWADDDDNAGARTVQTNSVERVDALAGSGAGDYGQFAASRVATTATTYTSGYTDADVSVADGVLIAFYEPAPAGLTVTTQAVSDIDNDSATGNGTVTEDGGDTVTRRGFVVSLTTHSDPGDTDPDVSDYETVIDEAGSFGEEAFDLPIAGLDEDTQYFVRAFAETTAGFAYGAEVNFTTDLNPIIIMSASPNITASGEATTAQLTPPSGKTTGDFDAGRIQDDENPSDTVDITTDGYTELEWCMQATDFAEDGETYEFRVTRNGVALDTYTVTPEWTVGTPQRRVFVVT